MNINYAKSVDDIREYMRKYKKVYLYGAGTYAQIVLDKLGVLRRNIDAIAVTSTLGNPQKCYELSVMELSEIHSDVNITCFIIAVPDRHISEIIDEIYRGGYKNVIQIENIMMLKGTLGNAEQRPALEITAKLGCRVNCKYCPQSLLYNRYFSENKNRAVEMSYEDYKRCIDKTPLNTIISFAGFVEPFLHKRGADMIRYAFMSGREVMLFTTLVGLTEEKWNKILDIPFYQVVLHTPDEDNFAQIPMTDEYIAILNKILDHHKPDGSAFVDFANCQSKPSENFLKIARNRVRIQQNNMTDRAGALEGSGLCNVSFLSGEIYCSRSYNMDNWVLLPDGTVVLCCMDYGLMHPLGNLITDEYDMIKRGEMYQNIIKGLSSEDEKILCRQCTFAQKRTKYSPVEHFYESIKK